MKKRLIFIVAAIIVFSMICMTACGSSESGASSESGEPSVSEESDEAVEEEDPVDPIDAGSAFDASDRSEKGMTIVAENAEAGQVFLDGPIEVGEEERVAVTADLWEGFIRVGLIPVEEGQSPDPDAESIIEYNVCEDDDQSAFMDPGLYMVRATVEEYANGTVQIEVLPIE